jgi:hypothetical protein
LAKSSTDRHLKTPAGALRAAGRRVDPGWRDLRNRLQMRTFRGVGTGLASLPDAAGFEIRSRATERTEPIPLQLVEALAPAHRRATAAGGHGRAQQRNRIAGRA